jgi:hypothetical protein
LFRALHETTTPNFLIVSLAWFKLD